jgi:hypothetical protein
MPITQEDAASAMAYALRLDARKTKVIVESTWKVSQRRCRDETIKLIEREISKTSNTGYGKAQIVMARRIIEELRRTQ